MQRISLNPLSSSQHFIWGAGALGHALELKIKTLNPKASIRLISRRAKNTSWPPSVSHEPITHWVTYKAYEIEPFLKILEKSKWNSIPEAQWIFMQNGIGLVDLLQEFSARHSSFHAARGSAYFGGYFGNDGEFISTGGDRLEVVSISDGEASRTLEWKKGLVNVCINPIAAIAGVRNGEVHDQPKLWNRCVGAFEEAYQVAKVLGVQLDQPFRAIEDTVRFSAQNYNSMLQDLRAGRPTEIEFLNGAVVKLGQKLGVLTPIHESLTNQILSLEKRSSSR